MGGVMLKAPAGQAPGTIDGPSSGASYTLGADRKLAVSHPGDIAAFLAAGWTYWFPPDLLDALLVTLATRSIALRSDPAEDVVPVQSGVAFPASRGLLVGQAGTATLVTLAGNTRTDVPLQQGWNPISCTEVTFGTASDVWRVP